MAATRTPAFLPGLFALVGACSASTGVAPTAPPSSPAGTPATSAVEAASRSTVDEQPPPLLIVGHHPWLGFLTLVRIYRQAGGEYLLVSDRSSLDGTCHSRSWRNVAADGSTFDRWLSVLDPKRLGEVDECHKSARDGSSWIVGTRAERGWVWRSRQQNGVESATCREFAGACGGIMALLGMSCRGLGCFTGDEREHGLTCP
jgi:hypothetical protein